jgi:hypothetical protein
MYNGNVVTLQIIRMSFLDLLKRGFNLPAQQAGDAVIIADLAS